MKRYNLLTVFLSSLMLIGTWGCSGILDDLAQNPNAGVLETAFTDRAGVNRGVLGIYGYMESARCMGIMGMGFSLARGDESTSNAEYAVCGQYNSRYNYAFDDVQHPFALLYTMASQATQILSAIPDAKINSDVDRNALMGEAYFLRAFAHFYLELNWRNISPIRTLEEIGDNSGRAPEEPLKVWEYIAADFQKARDLLPNKGYWQGTDLGRVTAGSAAAMLGKTYLYMSDIETVYGGTPVNYYTQAAKEFGDVISGKYGTYSLVNYADNFDVVHENNDESLFEIQLMGDRNLPGNGSFNPGLTNSVMHCDPRGKIPPFPTGSTRSGDVCAVVHDWVYDAFVSSQDANGHTDPRMFSTLAFDDQNPVISLPVGMSRPTYTNDLTWDKLVMNPTYFKPSRGSVYSNADSFKAGYRKWLDWTVNGDNSDPGKPTLWFYDNRSHGVNWRYLRLADVYLMYAEAVVKGGAVNGLTALQAIEKVRDRSQMPDLGTVTMTEIEKERILELSLEGHRFYDLLRWGKLVTRFKEMERSDPNFKKMIPATYDGFVENKHEWMPIPLVERTSNPKSVQNPGW